MDGTVGEDAGGGDGNEVQVHKSDSFGLSRGVGWVGQVLSRAWRRSRGAAVDADESGDRFNLAKSRAPGDGLGAGEANRRSLRVI